MFSEQIINMTLACEKNVSLHRWKSTTTNENFMGHKTTELFLFSFHSRDLKILCNI